MSKWDSFLPKFAFWFVVGWLGVALWFLSQFDGLKQLSSLIQSIIFLYALGCLLLIVDLVGEVKNEQK